MASINGISIKGVNHFIGHDGEPLCQGNLYLGDTKIGFWSQDSWGGPDRFILDPKFSKQKIDEAVIARNPEKAIHGEVGGRSYIIDYNLELLLGDCIELEEDEQLFKSAIAAGYSGILSATDGFHQATWELPASFVQLSDEDLLNKLENGISKVRESFWTESEYTQHKFKIYRSFDDFAVGDPIQLHEITAKKHFEQALHNAQTTADHQTPSSADKGNENQR